MRNLILALLAKEPVHGYDLRIALDDALGRLWPQISAGQVYVTLKRLQTAGLVEVEAVEQTDRPDKKVYALTAAGHEVLEEWFATIPVDNRLGEGFFLQLVAALASPTAPDVGGLIDRQRRDVLRRIRQTQDLSEAALGLTEVIAVEATLLHLQADLRWLEACETHVASARGKAVP